MAGARTFVALTVLLTIGITAPNALAARPAVIGGTPDHPYSPAAVALDLGDGLCSGALWKSRIVITAAHCVTDPRTHALSVAPGEITLSEPGGRRSKPSPVRVQAIVTNSGWKSEQDDIAFLILDRALGVPIISRIATPSEVSQLSYAQAGVTYVGFGLTQPWYLTGAKVSDDALAIVQNLRPTYGGGGKGVFTVFAGGMSGTCKGDSGGPFLADLNGQVLYLGPLSGGLSQPCDRPRPPAAEGLGFAVLDTNAVAGAQGDLITQALALANEPADGSPSSCTIDQDARRNCWQGRTWSDVSCWAGPKAVLELNQGSASVAIARTTGKRSARCPAKAPYAVTFAREESPGFYHYQVRVPKQTGMTKAGVRFFDVTVG